MNLGQLSLARKSETAVRFFRTRARGNNLNVLAVEVDIVFSIIVAQPKSSHNTRQSSCNFVQQHYPWEFIVICLLAVFLLIYTNCFVNFFVIVHRRTVYDSDTLNGLSGGSCWRLEIWNRFTIYRQISTSLWNVRGQSFITLH